MAPYDPFSRRPTIDPRTLQPGVSAWSGIVMPGQPATKGPWNIERGIVEGLEMCSWVYVCVELRAKGVASVPWVVYQRKGRSYNRQTWERYYNHPLERLLERPNDRITRNFLVHLQSMFLDVGGNALFKKVFTNGGTVVSELWPMSTVRAKPIPDEEWIGEYEFTDANGIYRLPQDVLIHAMRPNPHYPYWGLSPLQVLAGVVDTDVAMSRANRNLATNNNMPAAMLSDQNLKTTDQLNEVQDAVDSRWGRDQRGKMMVLPAGTSFIQLQLTPKELDYIESRKWNVSEICAAYDILPALFDPSAATFSNMDAAMGALWDMGIIPQLEVMRDAFNLALLSADQAETLFIDFDLSNVKALKVALSRTISDFKNLVTTGVPAKIASDRVDLGLPDYKGNMDPIGLGRPIGLLGAANPSGAASSPPDANPSNPDIAARQNPRQPAPANPSSTNPPMSGKALNGSGDDLADA